MFWRKWQGKRGNKEKKKVERFEGSGRERKKKRKKEKEKWNFLEEVVREKGKK